jgi:hypothetical protein
MTVILMLVLKWLLLLLGAAAVIALVLLCGVIFLDYHVDRISEKNKDP